MTIQEFDKTGWTFGMRAKAIDGDTYRIIALNFDERLIGLGKYNHDPEEITWVRCENATLEK